MRAMCGTQVKPFRKSKNSILYSPQLSQYALVAFPDSQQENYA